MGLSLKTTTGKVLASVGLVATAAAVAGLGTYGSWTSSTSASASVTNGTFGMSLNDAAGATGFTVAVDGMLPNDSIERLVTIKNTGNQDFGAVKLTTVDPSSSPMTSNTANGLQLKIEKCATTWTIAGTGKGFTCTNPIEVLKSGPIIGVDRELSGLISKTASPSANDFLKVTATLPDSAPGEWQGKTASVNFAFTATQRAATVK
ncbi:hypothetical protein IV498_17025 [Paenarthrobacter sp. Z7-10]|uniref:TasA family protein n=1 Tax=Paenarthrobacter sp. Z7-10 TaxID=2787635 RepID=UPI0022A9F5AF|nr:TasA family protein [Paenarthrobacter sp. Z7-10]MCZ2404831.1 hypothetical protein [Paenarthrobacter sp. Z7-10]